MAAGNTDKLGTLILGNAGKHTEKQRMKEMALVPMQRRCTPFCPPLRPLAPSSDEEIIGIGPVLPGPPSAFHNPVRPKLPAQQAPSPRPAVLDDPPVLHTPAELPAFLAAAWRRPRQSSGRPLGPAHLNMVSCSLPKHLQAGHGRMEGDQTCIIQVYLAADGGDCRSRGRGAGNRLNRQQHCGAGGQLAEAGGHHPRGARRVGAGARLHNWAAPELLLPGRPADWGKGRAAHPFTHGGDRCTHRVASLYAGLPLTTMTRSSPLPCPGHQAQAGGGHQREREAHEAAGPQGAGRGRQGCLAHSTSVPCLGGACSRAWRAAVVASNVVPCQHTFSWCPACRRAPCVGAGAQRQACGRQRHGGRPGAQAGEQDHDDGVGGWVRAAAAAMTQLQVQPVVARSARLAMDGEHAVHTLLAGAQPAMRHPSKHWERSRPAALRRRTLSG